MTMPTDDQRNQAALDDGGAALDWLAERRNCELSYSYGEEADGAWQVHSVNGGRNDREWTLIGEGQTPLEALIAARKGDGA